MISAAALPALTTTAKRLGGLALVLLAAGCESTLYGEGTLYIWNGGEDTVEFTVQGRTPAEAKLKFERGELFEKMVAGDYEITPIKKGVPLPTRKVKISKERMTIFNFDGIGCFARTDVAGMYKRGRTPVRVLELYHKGRQILELQNEINVYPGQRLPAEAPRLTGESVFQRFVVVPCRLLDETEPEGKVAEFVRRLR